MRDLEFIDSYRAIVPYVEHDALILFCDQPSFHIHP